MVAALTALQRARGVDLHTAFQRATDAYNRYYWQQGNYSFSEAALWELLREVDQDDQDPR